jgi:hypothetical protein
MVPEDRKVNGVVLSVTCPTMACCRACRRSPWRDGCAESPAAQRFRMRCLRCACAAAGYATKGARIAVVDLNESAAAQTASGLLTESRGFYCDVADLGARRRRCGAGRVRASRHSGKQRGYRAARCGRGAVGEGVGCHHRRESQGQLLDVSGGGRSTVNGADLVIDGGLHHRVVIAHDFQRGERFRLVFGLHPDHG